jgi:hypothetical protein
MAREWTEEQKQEAREREKARRAAQTETATVESETTVRTDRNPLDSLPEEFLSIIKDLTEKVGSLETKLAQKNAQSPRMVPMGAMDVPSIGTVAANMQKGEQRDGLGAQLPVMSRGLRLDDNVFRQFEQAFEAGQQVRINPESVRDHSSKTWGEILTRLGTIACPTKVGRRTCQTAMQVGEPCRRCGVGPTIKGVRFLSKQGEWKYIVRVPGLTQRQGLGDGFAQSELLPA